MLPPTEILELHRQQHACVEIAATALLAWEYLITFDREVELFWGKRWTPTSVLFFINRYTAIVGQVVNTYSRVSTNVTYTVFAIAYWLLAFCVIQLLLAETIVYIRVCAMYTGRKQLHKVLLAFFIFAVVGSTAILGVVGSRTEGTAHPYTGRQQCTVTTEYGFLWTFWLPILAYEATMCFLVIRKVVEYMKERSQIKNASASEGGWTSDLIHVILRDSVLYFVLMFLLSAGNGVLFGQKDPTLSGMLEPVTLVMLAVMGSRMLMNQRAELLIRDVAVTHATTLAFAGQRDEETTLEDEPETREGPSHAQAPGLGAPPSQTTSSSEPSTVM